MSQHTKAAALRKRITIERTFDASLEDVWAMWTTKDGIESWWGPDGFSVTVRSIDLRPGGELHYAMIATGPDQIAFMKKNGMPTTTELLIRYTEVIENRRLRYMSRADFIPGVEPYDVETLVELHDTPNGIHLVLTLDAMHDDVWTQRATAGWESELGRLEKALKS